MPEKKIDYQVFTWGPCVVKMKMTDEFYKVLWEESEASKTEDLLYQHRLAGIIQKEYKLRKLEKVEAFISDMVRIYDTIWDRWRNSDKKSVNKYFIVVDVTCYQPLKVTTDGFKIKLISSSSINCFSGLT